MIPVRVLRKDEIMGSWLVCLVPKFVARWLMFGSGERIKLPASWVPHLFGRAIGAPEWKKLDKSDDRS